MLHTDKEFIELIAHQDLSDVDGYESADLRIAEAALDPRLYTAVVDEYAVRIASMFVDEDNEDATEQNRQDEKSVDELMKALCDELKITYQLDDAQMARALEACRMKFQPGNAIQD